MKLSKNAKRRIKATATKGDRKKIIAAARLLAEYDLITTQRSIVIQRSCSNLPAEF